MRKPTMKDVIRSQMALYQVSSEQLAVYLHMSLSTFNRRLRDPDQFTLGELKKMKQVIHTRFEI